MGGDWLPIVAAGCGGGFVGTMLPGGHAAPFPALWAAVLATHPGWASLAHFIRNTAFGGIASFIVWAGYGGGTVHTGYQQIAASLILGAAGVPLVNSAVGQTILAHKWHNVFDESRKALMEELTHDE